MRHLFRRVGALARWLLPGHDSLLTIERSTIRCVEQLDPAQIVGRSFGEPHGPVDIGER